MSPPGGGQVELVATGIHLSTYGPHRSVPDVNSRVSPMSGDAVILGDRGTGIIAKWGLRLVFNLLVLEGLHLVVLRGYS